MKENPRIRLYCYAPQYKNECTDLDVPNDVANNRVKENCPKQPGKVSLAVRSEMFRREKRENVRIPSSPVIYVIQEG